jgi:hypothetical protein
MGGATYATYKLEHFRSGLFGFTDDLFCTFYTLSHPTYVNQTGLRPVRGFRLCMHTACF